MEDMSLALDIFILLKRGRGVDIVRDIPDWIVAYVNDAWTSLSLENWGKENICELKNADYIQKLKEIQPQVTNYTVRSVLSLLLCQFTYSSQ